MFGQSGFGVSANYTKVDSGLTYNNYVIGEQFALEGLSDSANLVGFYDKDNGRSVRPTTGATSSWPRVLTAAARPTRSTPKPMASWI